MIRDHYGLSERRACELVGLGRSTYRYSSMESGTNRWLKGRLVELAASHPRYGYRRLYLLLRREGRMLNHKRVYRQYTMLGLAVRRKKRKKVSQANRRPRIVPERANEQWSMDFMSDVLAEGRRLKTLNIVDDATRECPAIEVDTSISGQRVARVLEGVGLFWGLPKRIVVDNRPEFTSRALDQWAYRNGVELVFIRPGRPVENCLIESFNGKFRDEPKIKKVKKVSREMLLHTLRDSEAEPDRSACPRHSRRHPGDPGPRRRDPPLQPRLICLDSDPDYSDLCLASRRATARTYGCSRARVYLYQEDHYQLAGRRAQAEPSTWTWARDITALAVDDAELKMDASTGCLEEEESGSPRATVEHPRTAARLWKPPISLPPRCSTLLREQAHISVLCGGLSGFRQRRQPM